MTESRILNRLQNVRHSHAYILVGENTTILRHFAKALQCEQSPNEFRQLKPCGACLSCKVFESGNHPDVIYIKPTKTKAIGVDDVRNQIVLPMSEKPFRYRYKIFIVDTEMTHQAQNSLLKTIEEPASYGIFLFLTKSEDLFLPTVRSRCVLLKLDDTQSPLNTETTDEHAGFRQFAKRVAATELDIVSVYKLCAEFDNFKDSAQIVLEFVYDELKLLGRLAPLECVISTKKALMQNGNFQMTIETMLLKMIAK
ncbi:MAG: hypothetical protein FWG65_10395 [Turicibacter sp.]|nr:hypothetical protein [Turicibacter sp.]